MDLKPAASTQYQPQDCVMVVGPIDVFAVLVYRDWEGVQQDRLISRGVWPIRTTELIGLKAFQGDDLDTVNALDSIKAFEVSVGRSVEMRRGR